MRTAAEIAAAGNATALQSLDARIRGARQRVKAEHQGAQEKLGRLQALRPYVKAGMSERTAWRRLKGPVVGKQTKVQQEIWEPILRPGLGSPLTKAAMKELNAALPGPLSRSTIERYRARLSRGGAASGPTKLTEEKDHVQQG